MKLAWLRRSVLALVALGSLYASLQNLLATKDLGSTADDPVADWDVRFTRLKQRLPFQRGVVGYISDASIPGIPFNSANDEGEYILTQYAMAPIIIVKGTDQDWNVANLSLQAFEAWSAANHGRFDVISFKDGVYLLHRMAP